MKPNGTLKLNFGRRARFTIDPTSLDKAQYLVRKVPTECQWYFAIQVINSNTEVIYHLHDFFVPHQEVSAAYVESEPAEIAKAISALKAERGINFGEALTLMSTMTCWCHSHVNMASSPSSTDDKSWKDQKSLALSGGSTHPQAMIILNKRDEYFIRVYDPELELEWEGVPLEIPRVEPVMADVDALITERLKPKTYAAPKMVSRSFNFTNPGSDNDAVSDWMKDYESRVAKSNARIDNFMKKMNKPGWAEDLSWTTTQREAYWNQDDPKFDPTTSVATAQAALAGYKKTSVSAYKADEKSSAQKNFTFTGVASRESQGSSTAISTVAERLQRLENAVANSESIGKAKKAYSKFLSALHNYLGPSGVVPFASLYLMTDNRDLDNLVAQCQVANQYSQELIDKTESILFDAWVESGENFHTSTATVYNLIVAVRDQTLTDIARKELIRDFMDNKATQQHFQDNMYG